jgi:transcriptional regulator with XRE-family HTH domain
MPTTLGANVTRERDAAGLTMRALASMAGVSPSQLSNIESGKIRNPGVESVYGLATALGIRIEDLMGAPRVEVTTRYRSRSRGNRHAAPASG